MIENFGVIKKTGEILKSNLGVGINMYNNTKDQTSLDFFNTRGNGLYWNFNQKEIRIFSKSGGIIGYPSADLSSVVAIYPSGKNSEFPAPDNAVIYYPSGEVKLRLQVPELISDLGKEKNKYINNGSANRWFEMAGWSITSAKDVVLTMWVGFADDFFEERIVDPATGEFSECLKSGKL